MCPGPESIKLKRVEKKNRERVRIYNLKYREAWSAIIYKKSFDDYVLLNEQLSDDIAISEYDISRTSQALELLSSLLPSPKCHKFATFSLLIL